jgi:transposase-like protein
MEETTAPTESMLDELKNLPPVRLPINAVIISDSLRLAGENKAHVQILAQSEDRLPPIVVHKRTMHVIDGVHRVRAAMLRGEREIEALLFDGDETSSFVLAVKSNTRYGLPLSLVDRKAAATRIIELCPHWSNRMIASVSGLAAATVAKIRDSPAEHGEQSGRIGRDRRVRPRDSMRRRELAYRLMTDNPDASLREIARQVGLSPETVRSVRTQLKRGSLPAAQNGPEDPRSRPAAAHGKQPAPQKPAAPPGEPYPDSMDWFSAMRALRADPAFRSTDTGRFLLRMLSAPHTIRAQGQPLVEAVPTHCMDWLAAASRACALAWLEFADRAEENFHRTHVTSEKAEDTTGT